MLHILIFLLNLDLFVLFWPNVFLYNSEFVSKCICMFLLRYIFEAKQLGVLSLFVCLLQVRCNCYPHVRCASTWNLMVIRVLSLGGLEIWNYYIMWYDDLWYDDMWYMWYDDNNFDNNNFDNDYADDDNDNNDWNLPSTQANMIPFSFKYSLLIACNKNRFSL